MTFFLEKIRYFFITHVYEREYFILVNAIHSTSTNKENKEKESREKEKNRENFQKNIRKKVQNRYEK